MLKRRVVFVVVWSIVWCRIVLGQDTVWATFTLSDPADDRGSFQGSIEPIVSAESRVEGFVYIPRFVSGEDRSPINFEVYLRPGDSRSRSLLVADLAPDLRPDLPPEQWAALSWDMNTRITTGLLVLGDTMTARSTRRGVSLPSALASLRAPTSPDRAPVALVVDGDFESGFWSTWRKASAAIPPIAEQSMTERVRTVARTLGIGRAETLHAMGIRQKRG